MSTHIIDQIAAVKFPKERTGYTADYYMLATLSGDNNVINCASGRRARHWNLLVAGQHWRCLARTCEILQALRRLRPDGPRSVHPRSVHPALPRHPG